MSSQMLKDALHTSGRHVPRVDKYTPMCIQLLLELIGNNFQARELMLATRPVEVLRIMVPKETIRHDEVTITDWMRSLALEESRQPALPELKTKVFHELVRSPPVRKLPECCYPLGTCVSCAVGQWQAPLNHRARVLLEVPGHHRP